MESLQAVGDTAPEQMEPPTLDLLVLTFNCAAKLINVNTFATHLEGAFKQNATELPEVVVFSIQEVAPLSYAFIGDYFLSAYLARFGEAINFAAARHLQASDAEVASTVSTQASDNGAKAYTLIASRNTGYTAMMLFARDPSRLKNLREAEIGFGAAEMGNKGAVGLRFLYTQDGDSTELTFVAAHLAAMEWNLARRNSNWGTIMRGLTFENPESLVRRLKTTTATPESGRRDSGESTRDLENVRLLNNGRHLEDVELQRQLHDVSVFKPSSHLFVAGDLNYRIATTAPGPDAAFPSMDPQSENYFPNFFRFDQLTRERHAGRAFHGLSEHEVRFPPTYKYVVDSNAPGKSESDEVQWTFAPHRYPGWTDRILFLELPPWIAGKMNVRAYDALPVMRTSDHRPVFLRVDVPLIAPIDLAPPKDQEALSPGGGIIDPRIRLPAEIDPEAWERRAAARRKEVMAGWSMFLWSTQEGVYLLGTFLAATVAGYWLYQYA